jgi:hypothetical protein
MSAARSRSNRHPLDARPNCAQQTQGRKPMKAINQWLALLQQDVSPNIDECVAVLGHLLPALKLLKDTPQDLEWHAEGDVHIHTGIVGTTA